MLRIAAALMLVCAGLLTLPAASHARTVFDRTLGELPEGIAIDRDGTIYVTLSPRGEIRRIAPDGTQSTFAQISPAGAGFGPLGLAFDRDGDLYVTAATFDPASSGVYRVGDDGSSERIAGSTAIVLPNAIAFDGQGRMYVTDSVTGSIYRAVGNGPLEPWLSDPRLLGDGSFGFGVPFGANGIAYRQGSLYVTVTEKGRVMRVPVASDGTAGTPQVFAESAQLLGADGLAFDARGNLYVVANVQNRLVRLAPSGAIETLATAADGLDFPAGIAFGRGPLSHTSVFIANFAIGAPGAGPSISEIDVGVAGQPLP
jgi:sugar lactone lactonase YvrE